jgi:hypothetical protein
MSKKKIMVQEFSRKMHDYFGISNAVKYLDTTMSALDMSPVLDPMLFDDYLHEKFGNYDDEDGMSMAELIENKYGKEAREFVESMI